MTLTYRGLSRTAEIIWLITGATKAAPLARLCAGDPEVPAVRIACEQSRIVADDPAVQDLKTHPPREVHLWYRTVSPSSSTSTDP